MEIDMDMPNPDELEWMESNGFLEEDEEFPYPEEDDLPPPPPPPPKFLKQSTENPENSANQINTKKRLLPDPVAKSESSSEKRNRLSTVPAEPEIDEEWLRYSPPIESEAIPTPIVEEEKYISRFASEIDGNCFAVTAPDGNRVYAKMSYGEMDDGSLKKLKIKGYADGLISEPINVLMNKIEQEALTKALQASTESAEDNILVHHRSPVTTEKLWVEKYAPRSFTELLSDEQTNREVLLWLKQWDSSVFGSDIRSTDKDVLSALKRHSSVTPQRKVSDTSFTSKTRRAPFTSFNPSHSNNFTRDSSIAEGISGLWNKKSGDIGPPENKVLLLCGPPGLGKTTLAHVAAKHCGYRVVEINASDERSASTIETKILDVLQMNSIMSDGKPKCLVIDEIDGAQGDGKGAVEVILKMVAADKKRESGKGVGGQEGEHAKSSSRKKHNAKLSRPVICICNDLYAPALRSLRQIAKVHVFVQPTVIRVVNRLKYICNKEQFRATSISLTALAEYTECDIRSCLNTLQFLNKKNEQLNMLEIGSQIVGRKDVSRSAFDIWKEIFQKRKPKRERKSLNRNSKLSADFEFLHALISNRGEYELTMDGIHENMLQLHYHDPLMQKTAECLNILGNSDCIHQYIMRTQQMSLLAYQASKAIAVRCLISQIDRPYIEWPKSFQRYRTLVAEKKDLLRYWHTKITPSLSRHLSVASFVEDSLSPLLYILSPTTLRPISLHSHSEKEKGVLTQLVDTMVSYSITYKSKKIEPLPGPFRHEASEVAYSFDPPIDELIHFKDYSSDHPSLNFAMKQVLVHEVEKEKLSRESIRRGEPMEVETSTAHPSQKSVKPQPLSNAGKLKTLTNIKSSSVSKSSEENGKQQHPGSTKKPAGFNFFDGFRKSGGKNHQDSRQSLLKKATLERDSRPLLFKFNEGYTNAVKRPVKVRDLLL
ncbi:hypothetical protein ACHQM5_027709 [Ranunculus cassubicifolius]